MGVNTDREVQAQKTRRAAGPEGSEGACGTHRGRSLDVCPMLVRLCTAVQDCDLSGGCAPAGTGPRVLSVEGSFGDPLWAGYSEIRGRCGSCRVLQPVLQVWPLLERVLVGTGQSHC